MSEAKIDALEKRLESIARLGGLIKVMLVCAFGIGVWSASLEWRTHQLVDEMTWNRGEKAALRDAQHQWEVWRAGVDSTRFTSTDAAKLVLSNSEQMANYNQRLSRIEDAINVNRELLSDLKKQFTK